jgi:hypothetical protein
MDVDEAAQRILDYLAKRPNASDTAEGVAQWWLGAEGLHAAAHTVQLALDRLVREGLLTAKKRIDGTILFVRARPLDSDPKQ